MESSPSRFVFSAVSYRAFRWLLLLAASAGLFAPALPGQLENREIFVIHTNSARSAEMTPSLIIPINAFRSAAFHEYAVPPYRITEFTLSLSGEGNLVRFYAMESMDGTDARRATERAQFPRTLRDTPMADEALSRARVPVFQEEVFKTYPHSTHSGTAEYVLRSPEQVRNLRTLFFETINSETSTGRALRQVEFFIDVHESSVTVRRAGEDDS